MATGAARSAPTPRKAEPRGCCHFDNLRYIMILYDCKR